MTALRISEQPHFQSRNEHVRRLKAGAMSCGQITQAADLETEDIVHDFPQGFPDHNDMVMREEEFDPLQFLFVAKAEGVEPRPRQRPFLALPWAQPDHGDRARSLLHAANRDTF